MSRKSVFCISISRNQSDGAVNQLKYSGFSNNDISVLFPNKNTLPTLNREKNTETLYNNYCSDGTQIVINGALSWITGISSLMVPNVGLFIAAGPISAALNDTSVDGIAGGLIRIGISEFEAKRYEKKIKDGYILVSVYTDNYKEILLAQEIFNDCGAHDISTTGKCNAPNLKVSYEELSTKYRNLASY